MPKYYHTIVPLPAGGGGTHPGSPLMHDVEIHNSTPPKRHLDQLSRFSTFLGRD